jgi:hypothetical protein
VAPRPLDPANQLIQRQRQAAEDLRRELMDQDGWLDHPYFRSFDRSVRDYASPVSLTDLHAAASRAGILYVGDFHAVPAYPRFAAELRPIRPTPKPGSMFTARPTNWEYGPTPRCSTAIWKNPGIGWII